MFHLMMIIPAGVLLLLVSLLSLGTMANANKQIKQELEDFDADDKCILYTKVEGEGESKTFKPNDGGECHFVVWGDAVLAILAVVLSIVLGMKTFFGIAVFSFLAIIELGLSLLGAVWAFIVAVVITAGLEVTCKSYRDVSNVDDNVPCCVIALFGPDEKDGYFFYEDINTSRITAWFAMGLLICLAILYGIILIMFCCQVGYARRKGGSAAFTELPPESAD